jgi:hypothetical protein
MYGFSAGGLNRHSTQVELRYQLLDMAIARLRELTKAALPEGALLNGGWLAYLEGERWPLACVPSPWSKHHDAAGKVLGEPGYGMGALEIGGVDILTVEHQHTVRQGRLTFPQP